MREKEDHGKGAAIWIRTKKKKRSGVKLISVSIWFKSDTFQVGELIISSLREADEGTYTCLITNSKGSIGHNIVVRAENRVVAGRPQIQVQWGGVQL